MEDTTNKVHPLKQMDRAIFEQIDRFKTTPNYNVLTDFYGNLEEDQQKLLKGGVLLVLVLIPVMVLSFLWWQNQNIREELELRRSIMAKAQQFIGESRGVSEVAPNLISQNPIDGEDLLRSRVQNVAGGFAVDGNKFTYSDFVSTNISEKIIQAEALIQFTGLSTDELVNVFTGLIRREKMRINEVTINRNPDTGLLVGSFRVVHLAMVQPTQEE